MRVIRKRGLGDTTVKISGEIVELLDRVSSREDRSRTGEVVFLIKERAKQLGMQIPKYEKEVVA
jgi:hypothetical protein